MVKYKSDRVYDVIVYTLLAIGGAVCLFPMLYVVSVSLTPYSEYLRRGGVVLIPRLITLEAYDAFLKEPYLADTFLVTVFITGVGSLVNVLITVLMAYPLSKPDLVFRKFFSLFALLPLLIGGGIIPTYLLVKAFGLIDSVWAYIIPGLVWPYNLLITRTFFARIDPALCESAKIDGASETLTLFRIILPVSLPIMATIGLMYGVGHWNQYFASIMYINSPNLRTLQALLREVLDRSTDLSAEVIVPSRTLQMAGVVLSAIPIIIVYPFLQKHFSQGIMLGSVKG